MNSKKILQSAERYVKRTLSGESTGHDYWHSLRVVRLAEFIGKKEGADLFMVRLAAWLHDIADWKFHGGDDLAGYRAAMAWLKKAGMSSEIAAHVGGIVKGVSFKGAGVKTVMKTLEGQVVQDADRLDALGAIGISRTFAYGGSKGRELYNPGIKPQLHKTFSAYKKGAGPTLNHFYEKLLLLKGLMNTRTAKAIARERHTYLKSYAVRFLKEWDMRDV